MEQSSVSMIVLSKPDYDTASTSSLLVSNATYQNTVSSAGVDIVRIYRMASTGTYEIVFEDITFKNLTFQRNTKLFHLMQQLNTPVEIRNIQVSNVVYAGITVTAYDTNNVGNSTQVNIQNISVTDVDTNLRSFINIYEGADVNVSDSTFQRISNFDSGAVMSAGFQKAIARFYNTSFFNNTSVEGGVFDSQSQSIIECHQCMIYNNFAISSGVIKINSDGIFKFYNSEIYENKAMVASVAELFSTQTQSIVSNCTIRSNQILSRVEVLIQRFVFDSFRDYLLDNEYLLEHSENQYCFKIVQGEFIMTENVQIYDQDKLIQSTNGVITLENVQIRDTVCSLNIFSLSESRGFMSNITINNITKTVDTPTEMIYVANSLLFGLNLTYSESTVAYLTAVLAVVNMKTLNIRNVALSDDDLIMIAQSPFEQTYEDSGNTYISSIRESTFVNITTDSSKSILSFLKSSFSEITDNLFRDNDIQVLNFHNSVLKTIQNVSVSNSYD